MRQRVNELLDPVKVCAKPLRPLRVCTKNKCKDAPRGLLPRVNSAGFNDVYFAPFRRVGESCTDPWSISFDVRRDFIEDLNGFASLMPHILQRLNRSRTGRKLHVSGARLTSFRWGRESCALFSTSVIDGLRAASVVFCNAAPHFMRQGGSVSITFRLKTPPRNLNAFSRDVVERLNLDPKRFEFDSCRRSFVRLGAPVYIISFHCDLAPYISELIRIIGFFEDFECLSCGNIALSKGLDLCESDFEESVPSDFCTSNARRFCLFGRFFVDNRQNFKPLGRLCFR
ncbi:MAG: hypothetical protein E7130_04585 [Rikenellaceae bacterium]|nr:hypothetical protein [Rikenellaceae bacterium]